MRVCQAVFRGGGEGRRLTGAAVVPEAGVNGVHGVESDVGT